MIILDYLIPHQYLSERSDGGSDRGNSLYHAGVLIALGVAIHNLPEGLAVFISAATDIKLGSALAFAIAIHNIPEGIAVAVPIYYATKSRSKAFWFSVCSGLAEPIGALIGLYFFLDHITPSIIAYLFSTVAGIMVFVSFDELLPQMFQSDKHHHAISGLFLGMFIVMVSLAI